MRSQCLSDNSLDHWFDSRLNMTGDLKNWPLIY